MDGDMNETATSQLAKTNEIIKELITSRRIWDKTADKCIRYAYGDQWSAQDKKEMRAKKRPVVHDNMILPALDAITGFYLQSRADLVVKAVDEYSDVFLASTITSIFKHIDNYNNIDQEDRFQFQDGLITGVGAEEIWVDKSKDFQADIKCQWVPCKRWYLDDTSERYDYTDAQKMMCVTRLSKEQIEYLYGKKIASKLQPKIRGGDMQLAIHKVPPTWDNASDDYGNLSGIDPFEDDTEMKTFDNRYTVYEVYTSHWENKEFYVNPETGNVESTDELTEEDYAMVEAYTFRSMQKVIRLNTVIEGSILAQDNIDTEAEEFYHIVNLYRPYLIGNKAMGVVENATDPQDGMNKRNATVLSILMKSNQNNMFYEEGVFPPQVEGRLDALMSMGMAIKVNEGKLGGWKKEPPADVPVTLKEIITNESNNIQYITGAADALQGIAQRRESGRAKEIEYQRAAGRLSGIIENMRFSQILRGKAYIYWIQKKYTTERIFRITGANGMTQEQININVRVAGQIANDITIGKYDITLSYENKTQTERERNLLMLQELAEKLPPEYQPIVARWRISLSDLPQKEMIANELAMQQQMLAQQQQQQQMMQQANR